MTDRHEPGNCCADLHRKLDRILDLLTERRKPTGKQLGRTRLKPKGHNQTTKSQ